MYNIFSWLTYSQSVPTSIISLKRKYRKNGDVKKEVYYCNNQIHNENDKPAMIEYFPKESGDSTKIYCEKYYKYGKYHREGDLPAIIYYYLSTDTESKPIVSREIYYKNGIMTRSNNLPAYIEYTIDGSVVPSN